MILIQGPLYDKLKFVAQLLLPALATLYFTLAGLWGLPAADEVVGTIVAVDTFLGVILQLSSTAYAKSDARFDGVINVLGSEDGVGSFSMHLPLTADKVENAKEITLKVNKPQ